jgi:hypothetical protein
VIFMDVRPLISVVHVTVFKSPDETSLRCSKDSTVD